MKYLIKIYLIINVVLFFWMSFTNLDFMATYKWLMKSFDNRTIFLILEILIFPFISIMFSSLQDDFKKLKD